MNMPGQSAITAQLEPVFRAIGDMSSKARGALVETLAHDFGHPAPPAASRKAVVLDNIIAGAAKDVPLTSKVRIAPKIARIARTAPESAFLLGCDIIAVAEAILLSPEADDELLIRLCSAERQEHLQVIARRKPVNEPVAARIVALGEAHAIMLLMTNDRARLDAQLLCEIVARHGSDANLRSLARARPEFPDSRVEEKSPADKLLSGDELGEALMHLCAEGRSLDATDLLMRSINRDVDGGRRILERDDEKSLGAACHLASLDAQVYQALVEGWRRLKSRPMDDLKRAPVRYRLMRPAEIDRLVSRLPMVRTRQRETA